jgi:hypothetical protein
LALWQLLSTIFVTVTAIWWAASTTEKRLAYQENSNVAITGSDPAYLVGERKLGEAVSCPVSMPQARETVLSVHGTGVTWVDQILSLIKVVAHFI